MGACRAVSWQQCRWCWLSNRPIDGEVSSGSLIRWVLQERQKPGQTLHLALDIAVPWNRWCAVMRLRTDTWFRGTAAPMGRWAQHLRLSHGHCRSGAAGPQARCGWHSPCA